MIRLLQERDRNNVLDYLYKEAAFNIFIIGDIEAFGFDTDFQRIYADIDTFGKYHSVLLRYREHTIYYADKIVFDKEYLEIFKNDPFVNISGKTELLDLIGPYLEGFKNSHTYFCEQKKTHLVSESAFRIKELKTVGDARKLYDLLVNIKEFEIEKVKLEDFVETKMKSIQMGVTLFIEIDGIIVSSVAATAETNKHAMVVGVATQKEFRYKGYATALMNKLISIYQNDRKKVLCLFYDNPKAGKIYNRLGFKTTGAWDMYRKI